MKDYKLKLMHLCVSHTLGRAGNWKIETRLIGESFGCVIGEFVM